MAKTDWRKGLQEINTSNAMNLVPVYFAFKLRETEKAILFKMRDGSAKWFPKFKLRHDTNGVIMGGEPGWIYEVKTNTINKEMVNW